MALGVYLLLTLLSNFLGTVTSDGLPSAPKIEDFLRRVGHSLAVHGDWLYIDGGEVSQLTDGDAFGYVDGEIAGYEGRWSNPMNETISIPLNFSWTNGTVPWTFTPKLAAPVFLRNALWVHGDTFTVWGGQGSHGNLPKNKDPWQFTVDGAGHGSWETVNPSNRDVFFQIVRATGASRAVCNGVGFHFGGYVSRGSDDTVPNLTEKSRIPVPGLITYDIATRTWANESATDFNQFGTHLYGAATCLEDVGDKGVFFPIGGNVADLFVYVDDGSRLIDMATMRFYDVATKTWHEQYTSGESPMLRDRMCIAGAKSQDGTYEIYMYGGQNSRTGRVFNDVWILSLPAFTWFKTEATGTQRSDHECQIVGSQMISVGGWRGLGNWTDADPWRQGLAVLDLTSLTWADHYTSNTVYDSPQVVKDWYSANDVNTAVQWANDEVKTLFTSSATSSNATDITSQSSPTGAIAGGVVGGVVAVAALGVAFWLFRRRKRQAAEKLGGTNSDSPDGRTEADPAFEKKGELPGAATTLYALSPSQPAGPPVELDTYGNDYPVRNELDGGPVSWSTGPANSGMDGSTVGRGSVASPDGGHSESSTTGGGWMRTPVNRESDISPSSQEYDSPSRR